MFPSVQSVVLGDGSFKSTTLFPLISQRESDFKEVANPSVNCFASGRSVVPLSLLGLSSLRLVSFGKDCFHCGHLLEFRSGRARRRRAVDLVALERISFPEEAFPSVTMLIFQSRAAGEVLSRSPETAECSTAPFCVRQHENVRGQRRQFGDSVL